MISYNNKNVINAKSDLVYRTISAMILVPLFLVTAYTWLIESMINRSITAEDLSWLAVNASGLVALILGTVFMRGHNNRNVLVFDALQPAFYWTAFLGSLSWLANMYVPTWLTELGGPLGAMFSRLDETISGNSLPYVAYWLASLLWLPGIILMHTRVHWETRASYWIGKAMGKCRLKGRFAKTSNKLADMGQRNVLKTVASKGRTNFQHFMLWIYVLTFAIWFSVSLFYTFVGVFVLDVPFMITDGLVVRDEVERVMGYDYYGVIDTTHEWMNFVLYTFMLYYVISDYLYPDQIGSNKVMVENFVGNGAKRLSY